MYVIAHSSCEVDSRMLTANIDAPLQKFPVAMFDALHAQENMISSDSTHHYGFLALLVSTLIHALSRTSWALGTVAGMP